MLSGLSIFSACALGGPKATEEGKMPKRPLISVYYSYGSQMHRNPDTRFTVKRDQEDGQIYCINYNRKEDRFELYHIADTSLMERINEVIREHKIYRYKRSYNNPDVLDGSSWGFEAQYGDSTSTRDTYWEDRLRSGGSNAWPKDDGLKIIQGIVNEAMSAAEYLYPCDQEGRSIPSVSTEMAHYQHEGVDYIYMMPNDENYTMVFRFHDLTKSEHFMQRYDTTNVDMGYRGLSTQAERCFGCRILDDGHEDYVCLIVDEGAVETVTVGELAKGGNATTRQSENKAIQDVVLHDGKLCGVNAQGETVEIKWKE